MTGAQELKKLFLGGAHALNDNRDWINELNVFPVPDGDTGTNMAMTIISASKALLEQEDDTMETVCRAISGGALKGARGNSGVILSQLFRGFCKTVQDCEDLTDDVFVPAFKKAVDSAYKAVMKPKEGTILTVAKAVADTAESLHSEGAADLLLRVIQKGDEVLSKTPEMLPVLKEAGVVDSGGQGLMCFLHGVYDAYTGKEVPMTVPELNGEMSAETVDVSNIETADIKFGYCTEFLIKVSSDFSSENEKDFKDFLMSVGDSVVCICDEGIVKVHVHTNHPGSVIEKALSYGELSRLKIDNMREEHEERLIRNASELSKKEEMNAGIPTDGIGFIQVSSGEGFNEILTSLGVSEVINGGQTMNPSTEDFLSAIRKVPKKTIFLFPNNGNILLSANQAASLTEDREVYVIPTGSVTEGISCMVYFDPNSDAMANAEMMKETIKQVNTVEITYAVRDTVISGVMIKKDDYMAISGKSILSSSGDITETVLSSMKKTVNPDHVMATVYYGMETKKEDAEALCEKIREEFKDLEIGLQYGGQPVYYYDIAIE